MTHQQLPPTQNRRAPTPERTKPQSDLEVVHTLPEKGAVVRRRSAPLRVPKAKPIVAPKTDAPQHVGLFARIGDLWSSAVQAVSPEPAMPWSRRLGDDSVFRLAYKKPNTKDRAVRKASCSVGAFYNQLGADHKPVHRGVRMSDRITDPVRDYKGALFHPQVAKDFARQHNQYLAVDDNKVVPIAHRSNEYHQDVADMLYAAAGAEMGRHEAYRDTWNAKIIRQRIARALHSRTQTFDADATTELFQRVQKQTQGMGAISTTHISHTYSLRGAVLTMRTYHLLRTRVVDPTTLDESGSLRVMRREGKMDLARGKMPPEVIHFSDAQSLDASNSTQGRPNGTFNVSFGDHGAVQVRITKADPATQRPEAFIAQDLDT